MVPTTYKRNQKQLLIGEICWCRWIEVPLSQEILYTQLFGATTWKVPRFVSLSDGDRCIPLLTAPELRALGGTTWTASLFLLLGSLHAASVVHLRRWELRRAGLQLTKQTASWMENIVMYNAYLDIPMVSFLLHQHLVHLDCGKSIHWPCQSTTTSRPLRLSSPKTPTSRAYRVEGMVEKWMAQEVDSCGSCVFFWVEIGISAKFAKDWNIHV